MLQQKSPKDFIIATGETHSVRHFAEKAFSVIDVDIEWDSNDDVELGKCKKSGKALIKVNKEYNRPAETDHLLGDATLAKNEIGWEPKINFNALVEMMVKKDLLRVEQGPVWF